MTEAILDIKKWGNNLGVRLPAAVARRRSCMPISGYESAAEDGRITITPLSEGQLTLEQRLARFDPSRHGGEAMLTDHDLGAEKWQE